MVKELPIKIPLDVIANENSKPYFFLDMMVFEPLRDNDLSIVDLTTEAATAQRIIGITTNESAQQMTEIDLEVMPAYVELAENKQPNIHINPNFLKYFDEGARLAAFRFLMFTAMLAGKPNVEFRIVRNFADENPVKVNEIDLARVLQYPDTFMSQNWEFIQIYLQQAAALK